MPIMRPQERIAFSVGEPVTSGAPPSSGKNTVPVVFCAIPSISRAATLLHVILVLSQGSNFVPPKCASTTVILFMVRVPVLSLQIVVADPIVSQDESLLTRALSRIIFRIEYARVNVTAKGSPSGTTTTTIVTAIVKILIAPINPCFTPVVPATN
uniref:Uncharacterized protein n=1 Tax=Arundo donax TaxID=35708 RepID=A0A0A8XUW1_ARUDO